MQPRRVIEGQNTRIGRTVHGIAYDPVHDEIIVPNPLAAAVLVFRGSAKNDEPPIRVIQGAHTCFSLPHSASIDVQHDEILIGDLSADSVSVFSRTANGDVAPVRRLRGPKSRIDHPVGIAVDPQTNLMAVAGIKEILIFNRTDDGDAAPRAVIAGPKTGIEEEPWQLEIHDGKIFVAASNHMHHWVYPSGQTKPGAEWKRVPHDPWHDPMPGFIGVWNVTDRGDVPPRAIIKGPKSGLRHPSGLALNVEDSEIIASESVDNAVRTYTVPKFFAKKKPR